MMSSRFGAERVSYSLYAIFGAILGLAIGLVHYFIAGVQGIEHSLLAQPLFIVIAFFCMPGAIVIAAANNRAWRRQRSGEGSELAGHG
jgi:hypothetical protein